MKIYVASSWENKIHADVVYQLQQFGYSVYDYRNPYQRHNGFKWEEVNKKPVETRVAADYSDARERIVATSAFQNDFKALKDADVFVGIAPYGWSVSMEMDCAARAGKRMILYIPRGEQADVGLMAGMFDKFVYSYSELIQELQGGTIQKQKEGQMKNKVVIKFKKLHKDAKAPFRAHPEDRGADLTCTSAECMFGRWVCCSGLAFEFPEGIDAEVRARSSIHKTGLILSNGVGTIDNGYRGEVKAVFYRASFYVGDEGGHYYLPGDRFVQMIIRGVNPKDIVFEEVNELSETARGEGGFGSTGK